MLFRIHFVFYLLVGTLCASAQFLPLDAPFKHITDEEGLSNLTVNSIIQDADGYIWMGTDDGLSRYDGYEFKVYRHNRDDRNSLPDNVVYALFPCRDKGIWIGTNIGGLARYIPETDNFIYYQNDPKDLSSLSSNRIQSIYEDQQGTVWIGTYYGGLNTLNVKTGKIKAYQHSEAPNSVSSNLVLCVVEDHHGNIWIRTDKDIDRFNKESETFTHLSAGTIQDPEMAPYFSGSLFPDTDNILWATQKNYLLRVNTETLEFDTVYPSEYVTDDLLLLNITPMDDNHIWVSHNYGVFLIDKISLYPIPYYHIENRPTSVLPGPGICMLQDRSRSFWLAHPNRGISKLNVNRKAFAHFNQNAIGGQTVKALLYDTSDRIWVSVDRLLKRLSYNMYTGIYDLSAPGQYVQFFPTTPNCFMEASNRDLWVGTWGEGVKILPNGDTNGIRVLGVDGTTNSLPEGRVQALMEDKDHNVWIGTEAGLSLYNPNSNRYRHFFHNPDNTNSITPLGVQSNCIISDKYGNIWVGTWGGLTRISSTSKEKNSFDAGYNFIQYTNNPDNPNALSDSRVISILYDENLDENTIFAGTYGGGLNRILFNDSSDEIANTNYTTDDGLSNNVIYCLLSDQKSKLWMSTNDGLTCLNVKTGEITTFGMTDGLQADQFFWGACAKSHNGDLLFGGINGFNMFKSEDIVKDSTAPSIVFSDLKIFNKSVPVAKKSKEGFSIEKQINELDRLVLSHHENVFTIEFTGLHYTFPEANRYKYMLEGFDEDWIEVDSRTRFATYTNMNAGNYTFKVLACNYDGVWTKEPRELKIRIKPPFWKRWWFRIAILLIIAFVGYKMYRERMDTLQRDKELLEKKIKEGETLVREKIKEVERQEEEIRKRDIEGAEMRFVNQGIAIFSELLASGENNLKNLSQTIISEMVKYVDGVLGVLYIVSGLEDEKVLSLYGAYAVDPETMKNTQVGIGEGYVGTCFRDAETLIIRNVPENYVSLKSGLGAVSPKMVCLIPIKQRENIQGVIEIASLKEIEDYKISFIEKISENITANISIQKATEQMNLLLDQSQQQTEELRAQEEEMRQNLEEMLATQEELERQIRISEELQKNLQKEKFLFDTLLEYSPVRINFKDQNNKFMKASKSLLSKFGKEKYEEIIGLTEFDFSSKEYAEKATADDTEIMQSRQSRLNFIEYEQRQDGTEVWKNVSKIPMLTKDDQCLGVLSIVYDLTESKLAEMENHRLKNALSRYEVLMNSSAYFLSFSPQGQIHRVSSMLCQFYGLKADNMFNRPVTAFFKIDENSSLSIPELSEKLLTEENLVRESFLFTKNQTKPMIQTFTAIEIEKNTYEIIMIGRV